MVAPLPLTALNALQLPSGTGVVPLRTLSVKVVPPGTLAVQLALVQLAAPPASSTREVKLPLAWYGLSRSQSTTSVPLPTVPSLMTGRI
jgi:hypothetical protein